MSKVYIFDVDGVVTDPLQKKVIYPEIFDYFIQILTQGDLLCFNTGRALKFIKDEVLIPLQEKIKTHHPDKIEEYCSAVLAVGEKGGVETYFENGNFIDWADPDIPVSKELESLVKECVEQKYSRSMFFDPWEQTMISIEMNDNYSIPEYEKDQKQALADFAKFLKELHLEQVLRLDPTIIAIDIEHKKVGKHLGAKRILGWLKDKEIKPTRFITFGDSRQDLAMGEELTSDIPLDFIFTGDPMLLKDDAPSFPVYKTKARYTAGTVEYLSSVFNK